MTKRRKVIVLSSIPILIAIALAAYLLYSSNSSESEAEDIVQRVGRHYVLPDDEEPTIATIEDKTKVKTEFFRAAKNGDKLLVYSNAKKAIIYRPTLDRIIEVGPVSIAPTQGLLGE